MIDEVNRIKEYWSNRAKEHKEDLQGTTNDIYLRELEIRNISDKIREVGLKPGASIIDVGCGDGYSTMRLAEKFTKYKFVGVDYSKNMIINANRRKASGRRTNVEFMVADVLNLDSELSNQLFDIIITMRVLINLPELELQQRAITCIANRLVEKGRYIAVENFIEGQRSMNSLRDAIGLGEIPIRWHNHFFDKLEFLKLSNKHFKEISVFDFSSSYYYVTRVIYSKMCQIDGVEPSYDHSLYRVALDLPPIGEYSPVKLIVMDK